jgi:hypothetical protein
VLPLRSVNWTVPRIAAIHHIALFVLVISSLRFWTSLPLWMVIGDNIARVDTVSVETTKARGVMAIALAVTPS